MNLINVRKITFILFIIYIFSILFSQSQVIYGLSDLQKQIIDGNSLRFDVEDQCKDDADEVGAKIYVLGDSLTVGMRDSGNLSEKLEAKSWGSPKIQATDGFNISDSLPKVEQDSSDIEGSSAIVIALGTNPESDLEAKIPTLIEKLKEKSPEAKIYWVNVHVKDSAFIDQSFLGNERVNQLINNKSGDLGYTVFDWENEVTSNPDKYPYLEDGVHHTEEGYSEKSRWLAGELGQAPPARATNTDVSIDTGAPQTTGEVDGDFIQKISPAPFTGQPIQPTGVVLHWTGGSPNTSVEDFISIIGGRGLSVQLYIDGSGNVYQLVDDLATLTAHAANANSKTIGIEIAAGSDGTVETAAQEINNNPIQAAAVAKTVAYIIDKYGMEIDTNVGELKGVLSHHLISPGRKSDVGDEYLNKIIEAVKSGNFANIDSCDGSGLTGGSGGTPEENKRLGEAMAAERGWTGSEWTCLIELWTRESSWNHLAINDAEGNNDTNDDGSLNGSETITEEEDDAYGIPQSKPGGKMATVGPDWRTNPRTQITWGLDYIAGRYQTPCNALEHSFAYNWY